MWFVVRCSLIQIYLLRHLLPRLRCSVQYLAILYHTVHKAVPYNAIPLKPLMGFSVMVSLVVTNGKKLRHEVKKFTLMTCWGVMVTNHSKSLSPAALHLTSHYFFISLSAIIQIDPLTKSIEHVHTWLITPVLDLLTEWQTQTHTSCNLFTVRASHWVNVKQQQREMVCLHQQ